MNLRTFFAAALLRLRAVRSAVLVCLALLAFVGAGKAQTSYTNIVIPTNSVWRWLPGTNEVSLPTNAWRFLGFDDSAWPQAPAPFHFGTNSVGGDDSLTDG